MASPRPVRLTVGLLFLALAVMLFSITLKLWPQTYHQYQLDKHGVQVTAELESVTVYTSSKGGHIYELKYRFEPASGSPFVYGSGNLDYTKEHAAYLSGKVQVRYLPNNAEINAPYPPELPVWAEVLLLMFLVSISGVMVYFSSKLIKGL